MTLTEAGIVMEQVRDTEVFLDSTKYEFWIEESTKASTVQRQIFSLGGRGSMTRSVSLELLHNAANGASCPIISVLLEDPYGDPCGVIPESFEPKHFHLGSSVTPSNFRLQTTHKNMENILKHTSTHMISFRTSWMSLDI